MLLQVMEGLCSKQNKYAEVSIARAFDVSAEPHDTDGSESSQIRSIFLR
jgi:hypothetical protein